MNLIKCASDVYFNKFLGFTVHRKGIDLDPAKANAIQHEASQDSQTFQDLVGRVYCICKFIPALVEIFEPSESA